MKNCGKISVIVPVYKVEPYLDQCVSSIVNQTYPNLEIILVDDGSPDNCPAMCDAWAEKDQRIRVIHQQNQGGGAARNAGLGIATGEYIAFVDSDDYLAMDMYQYLLEMLQCGADIAECEYMEAFGDNAVFTLNGETHIYTAQDAMAEHICDRIFRQLIWNKLYRRTLVDGVRFPIGKTIDDEFFTYQVLGNAKKLIHSSRVCYAYRQQSDSVMHSMALSKRVQAVEAKVQRHEYVQRKFPSLTELSAKNLWFTCIYQGQLAMRELNADSERKTIVYLKHVLKDNPIPSYKGSGKEKMWLRMAKINLRKTCQIRNILRVGL